ncbi:hypothetical protein ACM9VS_05080 [Legionella pneumophila]|uniref:hypothetical protein n=1 Tax=Legionella pneumophila TaxID=446 RepID=UPI003A4C6A98
MNSLDFFEIAVGTEYLDDQNFSELVKEYQSSQIEKYSVVQPDANKIVNIR